MVLSEKFMEILDNIQSSIQLMPKEILAYELTANFAKNDCWFFCSGTCSDGCKGGCSGVCENCCKGFCGSDLFWEVESCTGCECGHGCSGF